MLFLGLVVFVLFWFHVFAFRFTAVFKYLHSKFLVKLCLVYSLALPFVGTLAMKSF